MTPIGTAMNIATTIVLVTAIGSIGTILYIGDDCTTDQVVGLQYTMCRDKIRNPPCIGTTHIHQWEPTDHDGVRRITTPIFGVEVPTSQHHCHGTLILAPVTNTPTNPTSHHCPPPNTHGLVWINTQFWTACGPPCPTTNIQIQQDHHTIPCIMLP